MGVGADGRGRCGGGVGRRRRRVRLGCAQNGGVVWMLDGLVEFKGGSITNTKATVRMMHGRLQFSASLVHGVDGTVLVACGSVWSVACDDRCLTSAIRYVGGVSSAVHCVLGVI